MDQVALHPGLPGGRWACLRPMTGHDERFVVQVEVGQVAELLRRLVVTAPGTTVTADRLGELAVSDRDRLLAAVYRHCFADQVEGRLSCRHCGEGFELSFSLAALESSQSKSEGLQLSTGPDAGGFFVSSGHRFRLPSIDDLAGVLGMDPVASRAELLARCLDADSQALFQPDAEAGEVAADAVEAAMAEAGPVLDLDLDALCSECGAEQSVHFDIAAYLLVALRREQSWLRREVHCLARVYGWSWNEILDLSRDERRAYVRLIGADRASVERRGGAHSLGELG